MLMKVLRNQFHPIFILLLACLLLNGCVTTQYGNFIQNASLDANHAMAEDAAVQIGRLYPPATTQFSLLHSVNDPFGQTLIEKLRLSGFAVQEVVEPTLEQTLFAAPQSHQEPVSGITLKYIGYIIDQIDDVYHARLLIDDTRLSRAFVIKADGIQPAGLWLKLVKKE